MARYKFFLNDTEVTNPLNWESLTVNIKRSDIFYGTIRSFSQDLEFIQDGYEILRDAYANGGISAVISVLVQVWDPADYQFKDFFKGRINLDNYEEGYSEEGVPSIKTNIEEDLFDRQWLSGIDISVPLLGDTDREGGVLPPLANPIYGPDNEYDLDTHSFGIFRAYRAEVNRNSFNQAPFLGKKFQEDENHSFWVTIGFDDIAVRTLSDVFTYGTVISESDPLALNKYVLNAQEPGVFDIAIDLVCTIRMDVDGNNDIIDKAQAIINLTKNESVIDTVTIPEPPGNTSKTFNINYSVNRPSEVFAIEDKLYFYIELQYEFNAGFLDGRTVVERFEIDITSASISIEGITDTGNTFVPGQFAGDSFERILNYLTAQQGRVKSDFFTFGAGRLDFLTNGRALRGFPREEDPSGIGGRDLFATFKDLFDTLDTIYSLGAGTELDPLTEEIILRIEERSYFYDNTVTVLDLGSEIKNYSLKAASDFYYDQIQIGFSRWEAKELGTTSLDEFNSKREYATQVSTKKNPYQRFSPYIGSGYIIEEKRRQLFSRIGEEQFDFDEDNFLIRTIEDGLGGFQSEEGGLSDTSGIINPGTVYNWRYSPARAVRNHLNFIGASAFRGSAFWPFNGGEGNYTAVLNGLSEEANILNFPDTIFTPEEIRLRAPLTFTQYSEILVNPRGLFTWISPITGEEESGYLEEVNYNPSEYEADFRFIREGFEIPPEPLQDWEGIDLEDYQGELLYDWRQNI